MCYEVGGLIIRLKLSQPKLESLSVAKCWMTDTLADIDAALKKVKTEEGNNHFAIEGSLLKTDKVCVLTVEAITAVTSLLDCVQRISFKRRTAHFAADEDEMDETFC